MLYKVSSILAKAEIILAAMLAGVISALILLNVITRSFDYAIYWVDEAAIYAMAWMTFLAASSGIHYGHAVAVTLIRDLGSIRTAHIVTKFADVCVFIFALAMIYFCWRWYRPDALFTAGFNLETFQGQTFNFIYAEPTTTLGIKKAWIWSIMWIFSMGMLLHATSNLLLPFTAERKIEAA